MSILNNAIGTPAQVARPPDDPSILTADDGRTRRKNTPGDQSMRRTIQDLVSSVDPNVKIEPEVEDVSPLLYLLRDQIFILFQKAPSFHRRRIHRFCDKFLMPTSEASKRRNFRSEGPTASPRSAFFSVYLFHDLTSFIFQNVTIISASLASMRLGYRWHSQQ